MSSALDVLRQNVGAATVGIVCAVSSICLYYCSHLTMEHLTPEQRQSMSKTSTERLQARLMRTGVDEEVVFAMDRPALLDAMAKVMLKGPEKAVATASAVEKPMSIWQKELALREQELTLKREKEERRKAEKEEKEVRRKTEQEEEEERRKAEREEEEARRQAERKADEDMRREELKLRTEELQRQQRLDAARQTAEESLLGRTKKITEIIKNVIPSQPSENAELPAFFDSIENLFTLYGVSDDLKSKVLLPKLTVCTRHY